MNAKVLKKLAVDLSVLEWERMDAAARHAALARPAQPQSDDRADIVAGIIDAVHTRGDAALLELTERLDRCKLDSLAVTEAEIDKASDSLPADLKQAMQDALQRIERFHEACIVSPSRVETAPGVVCERVPRAIGRVGLYVPAGSAPLPSTALMLGVPARLAGCGEAVLCTPPKPDGSVDAAVLYAARLCGITRIFKLGGAQAIAAMGLGTESVPACDKLFGPGNAWVTEAKRQVSGVPGGPAIDMPAGPSEVLVIADDTADIGFVAADLLSQAEHGPDSQVLLVSDSRAVLEAAAVEVVRQLETLPRAAIASHALDSSRLILVPSLTDAVAVSNAYAPEHLIVNTSDPRALLPLISNAGSVFLGAWSPESMGDYASGTNHVLPTYGHARALSGLSVDSFRKYLTVQQLDEQGVRGIGPCVQTIARAEGLEAHARAVDIRLAALEKAS